MVAVPAAGNLGDRGRFELIVSSEDIFSKQICRRRVIIHGCHSR